MSRSSYFLAGLFFVGALLFLSEFILRFFGSSLLVMPDFIPTYTASPVPFGSWIRGTFREAALLGIAGFFILYEEKYIVKKPKAKIISVIALVLVGLGIFSTKLILLVPPYLSPQFRPLSILVIIWFFSTIVTSAIIFLQKRKIGLNSREVPKI